MWVNATYNDGTTIYKNDALVCKTAKVAGAAFSISHWKPSSTATTAYIENLGDRITVAVTDSENGIAEATRLANQGISDARDAYYLARGAQDTADENTAAIQVTKDSIAALVEGIHFDGSGNITNINTSGLVTTADFNSLLSKKVSFDAAGHITNIDKSGLITESNLVQMFAEKTASDGYVKKSYIAAFVTELPDGRFQSNALVSADLIRFNGHIVANDTFVVDKDGNLTLNNITVSETGEFKGRVSISDGKILLENDGSGCLANGNISWDNEGRARFVGIVESLSPSGGNRVVIGVDSNTSIEGSEDNGLKIYDNAGNLVGAFGYTSNTGTSGIGMFLQNGNEKCLFNPHSLFMQSVNGADLYYVEISPFLGISFYKNHTLTKTYSNK